MKVSFLKGYNGFLSILLSLLGFGTACDPINHRTEYGVPHADFQIKGTITSGETHQGISNIRVIMRAANIFESDTVFTDIHGVYSAQSEGFGDAQTFHLIVEDKDGNTNGVFQSKDSTVEFQRIDITGGDGHWYVGKASKTIDVALKPTVK